MGPMQEDGELTKWDGLEDSGEQDEDWAENGGPGQLGTEQGHR